MDWTTAASAPPSSPRERQLVDAGEAGHLPAARRDFLPDVHRGHRPPGAERRGSLSRISCPRARRPEAASPSTWSAGCPARWCSSLPFRSSRRRAARCPRPRVSGVGTTPCTISDGSVPVARAAMIQRTSPIEPAGPGSRTYKAETRPASTSVAQRVERRGGFAGTGARSGRARARRRRSGRPPSGRRTSRRVGCALALRGPGDDDRPSAPHRRARAGRGAP